MNPTAQDQPLLGKPAALLISFALWLVSIVFAFLGIFALREIFLWALGVLLSSDDRKQQLQAANVIDLAHNCLMPVLGVVGLVVVLASTEYVFRHAGQPRLVRILAGIIAVECLIVVPVALIFWRH